LDNAINGGIPSRIVSEQRKPVEPGPRDPKQPQELRPPVPVQVAFWIWIASAVLSLVFAVLIPRQKSAIVDALNNAKPQGIAPSQYVQYANTLVVTTIVTLVLFALLYVFFAYKVRVGRNWARMTLTVLLVVGFVYYAYTGTLLSNGLGLLISVIALVLVYLPAANAYFAARRRPR
jgi:preprotein translocase subunit SecG